MGTADEIPFGVTGPPFAVIRIQPLAGGVCRFKVTSSDPSDPADEDVVQTTRVPSRIVLTSKSGGFSIPRILIHLLQFISSGFSNSRQIEIPDLLLPQHAQKRRSLVLMRYLETSSTRGLVRLWATFSLVLSIAVNAQNRPQVVLRRTRKRLPLAIAVSRSFLQGPIQCLRWLLLSTMVRWRRHAPK